MHRQFATAMTLAGAVVMAGCATQAPVPDDLAPPAADLLTLETAATGVQIYECSSVKDRPDRYEWAFKSPEAELFDGSGRRIGRHYAGPTWESDDDASKVVAAVKARHDSPDPGAIPWLLLSARSTSGSGLFGRTTSIQRLHTEGGVPPTKECGPAQAGETARVAYKAVYRFYAARPTRYADRSLSPPHDLEVHFLPRDFE